MGSKTIQMLFTESNQQDQSIFVIDHKIPAQSIMICSGLHFYSVINQEAAQGITFIAYLSHKHTQKPFIASQGRKRTMKLYPQQSKTRRQAEQTLKVAIAKRNMTVIECKVIFSLNKRK